MGFFCHPDHTGCTPLRCGGEEEDEEEFTRIVYDSHEDEHMQEAMGVDEHAGGQAKDKFPVYQPPQRQQQFSLPWADLNGNQKESLVTSAGPGTGVVEQSSRELGRIGRAKQSRNKSSSAMRSLLPFSTSSTGASFNSLYRPIFVTGIPTKAYLYKPIPTDPIDVEVHRTLRDLTSEASGLLALRRVEAGRYEIEGRNVVVYRAGNGLMVHEHDPGGPTIDNIPLPTYINLAANVALDLQRLVRDETFIEFGESKLDDPSLDGDDRYRAMQIACMQAMIREQEADRQWSRQVSDLSMRDASRPLSLAGSAQFAS